MNSQKLIEYLEIGHDIEFEYNGEKYSITPIPTIINGVCITKFNSGEYQEYENPKDLIEKATVGKQKLKEVLNQINILFIY